MQAALKSKIVLSQSLIKDKAKKRFAFVKYRIIHLFTGCLGYLFFGRDAPNCQDLSFGEEFICIETTAFGQS